MIKKFIRAKLRTGIDILAFLIRAFGGTPKLDFSCGMCGERWSRMLQSGESLDIVMQNAVCPKCESAEEIFVQESVENDEEPPNMEMEV